MKKTVTILRTDLMAVLYAYINALEKADKIPTVVPEDTVNRLMDAVCQSG